MNVIIYCRVSSDEQTKGCSLDYQAQTLKEYCQRNKYNIIGEPYREDYSAKDFAHRPEINKIMKYCKQHKGEVDLILFLRWNRYSRDTPEAYKNIEYFQKLGIEVNASDEHIDWRQSESKILLAVYISQAEVDNDKRSRATIDGIYESAKQGKCTNKAPRGYKNIKIDDYNKYVEIVPEEAKIIRQVFADVARGLETPTYIHKQYDRKGFKVNKNSWFDMLRNHFYIGEVRVPEHDGKSAYYTKGVHDAIIDKDTFYKVQEILDGNRKQSPKLSKKIHPDLFLRKYLVCPICGYPLTGATSSGNGGKYTYYNCSHNAKHLRCRAEEANEMFAKYVASLKPNQPILELYKEILVDLKRERDGNSKQEVNILKLELSKIKERISKLDDKFIDGDIDKNTHIRMIEKYAKEEMQLNEKIEIMLNPNRTNIEPKLDYSINLISSIDSYIRDAPVEVKCKLIGSMFPEKIVFDKESYRTNSYNKVLDLIYQQTNELRGKGKADKLNNSILSASVPRPGVEPGWK